MRYVSEHMEILHLLCIINFQYSTASKEVYLAVKKGHGDNFTLYPAFVASKAELAPQISH